MDVFGAETFKRLFVGHRCVLHVCQHKLTCNNQLLSSCVKAELSSRAVTSCVEGLNCDAAVPLLHHKERRHVCDILNQPAFFIANLVSEDSTSRVRSLRRTINY